MPLHGPAGCGTFVHLPCLLPRPQFFPTLRPLFALLFPAACASCTTRLRTRKSALLHATGVVTSFAPPADRRSLLSAGCARGGPALRRQWCWWICIVLTSSHGGHPGQAVVHASGSNRAPVLQRAQRGRQRHAWGHPRQHAAPLAVRRLLPTRLTALSAEGSSMARQLAVAAALLCLGERRAWLRSPPGHRNAVASGLHRPGGPSGRAASLGCARNSCSVAPRAPHNG